MCHRRQRQDRRDQHQLRQEKVRQVEGLRRVVILARGALRLERILDLVAPRLAGDLHLVAVRLRAEDRLEDRLGAILVLEALHLVAGLLQAVTLLKVILALEALLLEVHLEATLVLVALRLVADLPQAVTLLKVILALKALRLEEDRSQAQDRPEGHLGATLVLVADLPQAVALLKVILALGALLAADHLQVEAPLEVAPVQGDLRLEVDLLEDILALVVLSPAVVHLAEVPHQVVLQVAHPPRADPPLAQIPPLVVDLLQVVDHRQAEGLLEVARLVPVHQAAELKVVARVALGQVTEAVGRPQEVVRVVLREEVLQVFLEGKKVGPVLEVAWVARLGKFLVAAVQALAQALVQVQAQAQARARARAPVQFLVLVLMLALALAQVLERDQAQVLAQAEVL